MEKGDGWRTTVVQALRHEPAYVLWFGTVALVAAALTGAHGILSKDVNWIASAWAICVLLGTIFVIRMAVSKATLSKEPETGVEVTDLVAEADRIRQQIQSGILKSDLSVSLRVFRIVARKRAEVSLRSSYRIKNLTDEDATFEITTHLEASPSAKSAPRGYVRVVDVGPGATVVEINDVEFKGGGEDARIQKLESQQITLKPGKTYEVVWGAERYEVDLPYTEFWATAHPLLGMKFTVQIEEGLPLEASADCYRSCQSVFKRTDDMPESTYEAHGPFLPFQGIFLRIQKPNGTRRNDA